MSEVVQYATNYNKIFKELAPINVKSTQASLKAYIIWQKKSSMLNYSNHYAIQAIFDHGRYNEIDFFLSLCIIGKGAKEWK
jgi:hypothetical protein